MSRDECAENETSFVFRDVESDDFEALSQQVAGLGQKWVKTSTQDFRGRWTSAYLHGGVAVHSFFVNCAMHQRVRCPEGTVGLGVSIGARGGTINGIEPGRKDVVVSRSSAEAEIDASAKGGTTVFLSVKRGLVESLASTSTGRKFLDLERVGGVSVLRTPYAAGVLEAGCAELFRACRQEPDRRLPQGTGTALVAAVVAALDVETGLGAASERREPRHSVATFLRARDALVSMAEFDYAALATATGRSPRSIQMAFAQHAGTTPLRYFRALRLHHVRDALLTDTGREMTIGDIAAAHGFWSWSRFSQLYGEQFGEKPSETRARGRAAGT